VDCFSTLRFDRNDVGCGVAWCGVVWRGVVWWSGPCANVDCFSALRFDRNDVWGVARGVMA